MLLSIIVISFNSERYIEQALSSCLYPGNADYEIIVVDNGSEDQTRILANETLSNQGVSFRIIENGKNEGPGVARNIGIENASGEYCLLLDGDDWFEPEAIPFLMGRLREWCPDLLMFNHQQVWPDGRKIPNTPNRHVDLGNKQMDLTEPGVRKGAIRNLHVSWNKVYRKRFINDAGLSFPNLIYYEDLVWSVRAMAGAGKFYFVPDVLHNYRQHSKSSIHSINDGHFSVIHECRRIRHLLIEDAECRRWYGMKLYGYVRSTLFGVINTRSRIPKEREGEYLGEMANLLREFRGLLGIRTLDVRLLAAATGSDRIYSLVSRWMGRLDQVKKRIWRLRQDWR